MVNPDQPEIFVFGSNLAGRHGAGAALHAFKKCGARYGVGEGRTGDSYALPTKDENLRVLPLNYINKVSVTRFMAYAKARPELTFRVTAVGCGLAGYKPEQIAPFFRNAPENCLLPAEFKAALAGSGVTD